MKSDEIKAAIRRHLWRIACGLRSSWKRACFSCLLAALLLATSCVHKKAVIFEHDASSGQNRMTYCGKPISVTEMYELGEKADEDQIDLIMRQDGKEQKLDLKRWHTGMKLLPTAILRMPGDLVD